MEKNLMSPRGRSWDTVAVCFSGEVRKGYLKKKKSQQWRPLKGSVPYKAKGLDKYLAQKSRH